ncbi:MAG TPA: SET domain-containing protein [Aggregatilineales bacterium]|nr:SET domain-containing protein [Anaerolineales bacterium]HRE48930.1 SET domain-containing protein [Aggregatilineales bacterium]
MSYTTATSSSEQRFIEKGVVAKPIGSIGWGLFAETTFAPGEPVFQLELQDESRLSVRLWADAFHKYNDRSVTIIPDFSLCVEPEHPFWYVNHHCEPNSGFVNWGWVEEGKIPFVAHRPIQPGEQIHCDYSLITVPHDGSAQGAPWVMNCLCGDAHCRGELVGFHALPLPLQLAGMLPEEMPRGRIPANVLSYEPALVEILKAYPKQYRSYLDALRQIRDISVFFHRKFDTPGARISA